MREEQTKNEERKKERKKSDARCQGRLRWIGRVRGCTCKLVCNLTVADRTCGGQRIAEEEEEEREDMLSCSRIARGREELTYLQYILAPRDKLKLQLNNTTQLCRAIHFLIMIRIAIRDRSTAGRCYIYFAALLKSGPQLKCWEIAD